MNNAITVTHIGTDHVRQTETTTHWFAVKGRATGFGLEIDGIFGWSDSNGVITIVDEDNCPLTDGDGITEAVRQAIEAKAIELTENPV